MKKDDVGSLKSLWEMRHLSVEDCLKNISTNPDLKFLLGAMGVWFFVRLLLVTWIGAHVIYFVYRIFSMVAG
jgi:hypothetical protein